MYEDYSDYYDPDSSLLRPRPSTRKETIPLNQSARDKCAMRSVRSLGPRAHHTLEHYNRLRLFPTSAEQPLLASHRASSSSMPEVSFSLPETLFVRRAARSPEKAAEASVDHSSLPSSTGFRTMFDQSTALKDHELFSSPMTAFYRFQAHSYHTQTL